MSLFLADFPPSLGSAASAGEHYMIIDSFESANAVTSGDKKLSSIIYYFNKNNSLEFTLSFIWIE